MKISTESNQYEKMYFNLEHEHFSFYINADYLIKIFDKAHLPSGFFSKKSSNLICIINVYLFIWLLLLLFKVFSSFISIFRHWIIVYLLKIF